MDYNQENHDKIEKSFHDALADEIGVSNQFMDVWEVENWNFILNIIGELKDKKILDVGCGFGRESLLLAKGGAFVTGIDISNKSIAIAQKSALNQRITNAKFKVLKVEDLVDEKLNFDVIYCRGSLHHFYNVKKVIKILYNCLKENGLIIVQEPKAENPIAVIGRKFFNPSTPTEHPFETGELKMIFKEIFGNSNVQYFNLFSPLCFTFEKISFLNSSFLKSIMFKSIAPIDRLLLRYEFFKKYSWLEIVWSFKD